MLVLVLVLELVLLVYDCSLDLEERKRKVITLDSAAEVAAIISPKVQLAYEAKGVVVMK